MTDAGQIRRPGPCGPCAGSMAVLSLPGVALRGGQALLAACGDAGAVGDQLASRSRRHGAPSPARGRSLRPHIGRSADGRNRGRYIKSNQSPQPVGFAATGAGRESERRCQFGQRTVQGAPRWSAPASRSGQ